MTEQESKLWRTVVRVEKYDKKICGVIVPGWDYRHLIELRVIDIPIEIVRQIEKGHSRFVAKVNVGAEKLEDIMIDEWETNEGPPFKSTTKK